MDMTQDAKDARHEALEELLHEKLLSSQDKSRSSYLACQIEDLYADYDQDRDGDQDCARSFDVTGDFKPWLSEPDRTFRNWSHSAPGWLKHAMHAMTWWHRIEWGRAPDSNGPEPLSEMDPNDLATLLNEDGRVSAPSIYSTEVFGSRLNASDPDDEESIHTFMLDIDHRVVLIPSSTDNHFHLYIDHQMPWQEWKAVIEALGAAGVISENYAAISIARGETMLRAPWIRKGLEREDKQAALESWINGAARETPAHKHWAVPW